MNDTTPHLDLLQEIGQADLAEISAAFVNAAEMLSTRLDSALDAYCLAEASASSSVGEAEVVERYAVMGDALAAPRRVQAYLQGLKILGLESTMSAELEASLSAWDVTVPGWRD